MIVRSLQAITSGLLLLAVALPCNASAATLAQVRKQLLGWRLQPPPLFPSRLPPGFGSANVTLDRFSGVDFDVEFGKPANGCQRINDADMCIGLRRAGASALNAIIRNPMSYGVRRLRVRRRSAWLVGEAGNAGGWDLVWHEQGRTYIAWDWATSARTALRTLSPFVEGLRPLSN
jgi:hypothetical protein